MPSRGKCVKHHAVPVGKMVPVVTVQAWCPEPKAKQFDDGWEGKIRDYARQFLIKDNIIDSFIAKAKSFPAKNSDILYERAHRHMMAELDRKWDKKKGA